MPHAVNSACKGINTESVTKHAKQEGGNILCRLPKTGSATGFLFRTVAVPVISVLFFLFNIVSGFQPSLNTEGVFKDVFIAQFFEMNIELVACAAFQIGAISDHQGVFG